VTDFDLGFKRTFFFLSVALAIKVKQKTVSERADFLS